MTLSDEQRSLVEYRFESAQYRLRVAEKLFESSDYGESVGRSYYAIFTAARSLLATKQLDSKTHSGVISLFNLHFVKTGILPKEFGKIIAWAKDSREKYDYADYVETNKSDAEHQIEMAKSFLTKTEIVLNNILG